MADNTATNYSGKSGKATIVPQGQTRGAYGADTQMTRREPSNPPEIKP